MAEVVKRFELVCPECKCAAEVSFSNLVTNMYGCNVNFRCVNCGVEHMLGGCPSYRKMGVGDKLCAQFMDKEVGEDGDK